MNKEDEAERSMSRFLPYSPEQAYLLPPSVKDELGAGGSYRRRPRSGYHESLLRLSGFARYGLSGIA